MKLIKQVVTKKNGKEVKRYTNYMVETEINDKVYRVAIEPKTFGRDWTHPATRQSFTILDLIATLEVVDKTKA